MQAHLAASLPIYQQLWQAPRPYLESAKTVVDATNGKPMHDPQMAQLSDSLKRGSSLMIAALISGGALGKPLAASELLGFASWYAAMSATPKIRNLFTQARSGVPMGLKYHTMQKDEKRVFEEGDHIPFHLIPESLRRHVSGRLGDTIDNVEDTMQKIATQADTAWLLAAGPLTPVLASALAHLTQQPIERALHGVHKTLATSPERQLALTLGEGHSDLTHWWQDFSKSLTQGLKLTDAGLQQKLLKEPHFALEHLSRHLHDLPANQLERARQALGTHDQEGLRGKINQLADLHEKLASAPRPSGRPAAEALKQSEFSISGARNSLRRYRLLLDDLLTPGAKLSVQQIQARLEGASLPEFQKLVKSGAAKAAMQTVGDCPKAYATLVQAVGGRQFQEAFKRFGVLPAKHLAHLTEAATRTRLWRTRYLGMLGGGATALWAAYSALALTKSAPANVPTLSPMTPNDISKLTQDPKLKRAMKAAMANGAMDQGILSQMPGASAISPFQSLYANPLNAFNTRFGNGVGVPPGMRFSGAFRLPSSPMGFPAGFSSPMSMPAALAFAQTTAPGMQRPTGMAASAPANPLKQAMQRNRAAIYALNIRTFAAQDKNQDGKFIWSMGETGTFLNAINRLDELKALGINAIHMLPIVDAGDMFKFGNAGSVYAAENMHRLNPQLAPPGADVMAAARLFVQECHKRGIAVMADIPSCATLDLAMAKPDLMLLDKKGHFKIPTNWVDILMMKADGAEVRKYYDGFFDLMANQLGVDGFRADVARARSDAFWQRAIQQLYPDKAWLAETYTEETSEIANLPADRPAELLKSGFDSQYGQFHIFHNLASADDYMHYLTDAYEKELKPGGPGKSFISSMYTHDDKSSFKVGGPTLMMLQAGLMATQPWSNVYMIDGWQSGDPKELDIFNFTGQPGGKNPEIGQFARHMLSLRAQHAQPSSTVQQFNAFGMPIPATTPSNATAPFYRGAGPANRPEIGDLLTEGWFVPLKVHRPPMEDGLNQIIAFTRHLNGRTVLVLANKDLNARHKAHITLPGVRAGSPMSRLTPAYGAPSSAAIEQDNTVSVNLGPGTFHLFEVDTPNLLQSGLKAYPGLVNLPTS